MDKSVFARKLREAREKSGFTLEQVAEAIGVTPEQVASWESGEQVPSALHLGLLTTLYAVEGDSLFDEGPLRFNDPLAVFAYYEEPHKILPPKVLLELREWLNFVNDYAEFASGEGVVPRQVLLTLYSGNTSDEEAAARLEKALDDLMNDPTVLVYKGYLPPEVGVYNLVFFHPQVGCCSFINVGAYSKQVPVGLDRYSKHALRLVRKAVEEGRLSVSAAASLLRVNSTTIERELLAS
jgi:transcriptional regulator with XRE-family HTH domain